MSDLNDKQLAINNDHGVNLNAGFLTIATLEDALKVAKIIANSGLCPTNYKNKPDDVLVALQMGAELGLKPMQALQNIATINGRPSLWGDAMLAVCRGSTQFEYIIERYTDTPQPMYTCIVKRLNNPETIQTFSQSDAKLAGLWGRASPSPWACYPKRMLQMRARGFALRDAFPDLLRGILTGEEARDIPVEKVIQGSRVDDVVEGQVDPLQPDVVKPQDDRLTTEQIEILQIKIDQSGTDVVKLCSFYTVDKIEDLLQTQWPNVVRQLDKKISQKARADSLQALAEEKTTPEIDEFYKEMAEADQAADSLQGGDK